MKNTSDQPLFIKFIFVGMVNTAFGYGCYYALLKFGLHYSRALLVATVLGVMFNFKSIGLLVFKSKNNLLIINFIIGYAFVYIINMTGIRLLLEFDLGPEFAGAILVLPMAALSFLINKKFVFKK